MATAAQQTRKKSKAPEQVAAKQAAELARVLSAFAESLRSLDTSPKPSATNPVARGWWRAQAGHFKDDPTFPEFVRRVQEARKRDH